MSTLTEFLLARIAEDESVANEATDGPWRYDPTKVNAVDRGEAVFAGQAGASATTIASTGPPYDMQSMFDAVHIARHDPARVLAEVEAKRRIVAAHEVNCIGVHTWPFTDLEIRADRAGVDVGLWAAIGYSALPYADHPDYLPEWKP